MPAALSRKRRVVVNVTTTYSNWELWDFDYPFSVEGAEGRSLVRPHRSYTCNFQDGRDINMRIKFTVYPPNKTM